MSINQMEFFGSKSLLGYTYQYFLESLQSEARVELSLKIESKGGKITFSSKEENIIVIQSIDDIKSQKFPFIERKGNIHIFFSNHFDIIKGINTDIPPIKCIVYQDLIEAIEAMDIDDNLEFHFQNNLPRGIDSSGLISLITVRGKKKKLVYHQFTKSEKIKGTNILYYDIPEYDKDAHEGFSLFRSWLENNEIEKYLKNQVKKTDEKKENDDRINMDDAEPRKENFYCQLCKKKFVEYQEHMVSSGHVNEIKDNQTIYDRIEDSFNRIRDYTKIQILKSSNNNSNIKGVSKNEENILLSHNNLMTCSTMQTYGMPQGIATNHPPNDGSIGNHAPVVNNTTTANPFIENTQKKSEIKKYLYSDNLKLLGNKLEMYKKKRKYHDWKLTQIQEPVPVNAINIPNKRWEFHTTQMVAKCIAKMQKKMKKENKHIPAK